MSKKNIARTLCIAMHMKNILIILYNVNNKWSSIIIIKDFIKKKNIYEINLMSSQLSLFVYLFNYLQKITFKCKIMNYNNWWVQGLCHLAQLWKEVRKLSPVNFQRVIFRFDRKINCLYPPSSPSRISLSIGPSNRIVQILYQPFWKRFYSFTNKRCILLFEILQKKSMKSINITRVK